MTGSFRTNHGNVADPAEKHQQQLLLLTCKTSQIKKNKYQDGNTTPNFYNSRKANMQMSLLMAWLTVIRKTPWF